MNISVVSGHNWTLFVCLVFFNYIFKMKEQLELQQADVSIIKGVETVEVVGLFLSSVLLTHEGCPNILYFIKIEVMVLLVQQSS